MILYCLYNISDGKKYQKGIKKIDQMSNVII
jgi:hypothetical protein